MNPVAFYDTETTGLPLFNEPSEDPRQPHIVQLGACLVDLDTWKTLATIDVICRPEGWTIPDEVAAIHGITTEMAADVGVPESLSVEMLLDMVGSRLRVAHNQQFDARIVRIACMRHFEASQADGWKDGAAECTAILSTPILKLPPTEKMKAAKRFHHKMPNLGEAYRFFTGRELVGAHSALVDVQACIEVYRAIKEGRHEQALAA
jgi:DNA polymerase-3 subunit epsilon